MKIKLAFSLLLIAATIGCNQKSQQVPQPQEQDQPKEKIDSFFPVTAFLKGQLRILDSLPITPLQIITIKEKIDSVWLKKEDLHKVLEPFISPEINQTNLTSLFKESSFNDLSLNAITFTYDIKTKLPDSIPFRHWDVYINPETGDVSKIYMVKETTANKKDIIQQLTWQTDKSAKIVSLENMPNGTTQILREETFIWKF